MREMNRQSQEDLQGSENALYGTIPKNTRHYVFCQTHWIYTESLSLGKLWTSENVSMNIHPWLKMYSSGEPYW